MAALRILGMASTAGDKRELPLDFIKELLQRVQVVLLLL